MRRSAFLAALAVAAGVAAPATAQDRLRQEVDVRARDRDLREVVAELARTTGRNLLVDPEVEARVTLTLRGVSWRVALDLLAERTGCRLEELPGGVLRLTRPRRVSVQLHDADARVALLLLVRYAGKSVVIGPDVQGRVTLDLRDAEWGAAVRAVASLAGDAVVLGADTGLLQVGAAGGAAPVAPDAVLAGRLVARTDEGLRVALEGDGGGELELRLPTPEAARRRLLVALDGLRPGDRLVFTAEDGVLEQVVARARQAAERARPR